MINMEIKVPFTDQKVNMNDYNDSAIASINFD